MRFYRLLIITKSWVFDFDKLLLFSYNYILYYSISLTFASITKKICAKEKLVIFGRLEEKIDKKEGAEIMQTKELREFDGNEGGTRDARAT